MDGIYDQLVAEALMWPRWRAFASLLPGTIDEAFSSAASHRLLVPAGATIIRVQGFAGFREFMT